MGRRRKRSVGEGHRLEHLFQGWLGSKELVAPPSTACRFAALFGSFCIFCGHGSAYLWVQVGGVRVLLRRRVVAEWEVAGKLYMVSLFQNMSHMSSIPDGCTAVVPSLA